MKTFPEFLKQQEELSEAAHLNGALLLRRQK
jgi:hypothetical protein